MIGLRRWLFFGLVVATTLLGAGMMAGVMEADGITPLEGAILVLFTVTFAWISVSFWTGTVGFVLRALRVDPLTLRRTPEPAEGSGPLHSRTAVVMPVHNEDPERVTRRLAAVLASLGRTGHGHRFDVHLLSDTTDPALARREEAAWRDLRRAAERPQGLFYRRRSSNDGRKAGNIAAFCREWEETYDFMVVLDADSLMEGSALVKLVRTMEENPDVGLIQTLPLPARQETLFGRLLQFSARLHGPMLAAGQSFWQADTANYWGHNAVVRLSPFRDHCRLPVLPGEPPLGGEILSHDFVEAALLRRAGWKVHLVPFVGDSFEEVPGNIPDYARRDRRWAQGSLQHLGLLGLRELHPASRLHFVLGAMGYVSSALWLVLLVAGTAYVLDPGAAADAFSGRAAGVGSGTGLPAFRPPVSLLLLTAVVLFAPRALALGLALARNRRSFGGAGRLLGSGLLETLFAVLSAPVMMMYHSWFVLRILAGQAVGWEARSRGTRPVPWDEAWKKTAGITGVGVAWTALTLHVSPTFLLWLAPIVFGLILAAPLVRWTSSPRLGAWTRRLGLFLVPSEIEPPFVVERSEKGVHPPDTGPRHARYSDS